MLTSGLDVEVDDIVVYFCLVFPIKGELSSNQDIE